MSKGDLMTAAAAAARVGVPRRTFLRFVKAEMIAPAMKLDGLRGAYLFDPADVDALAEERSR